MLWFRFKMFLLEKYQWILGWKWWIWKLFNRSKDKQHYQNVVVFTSEIGDYLLFRPYLKALHDKFGSITLVGNSAFKSIATHFDNDRIEHFIWINKAQFQQANGRKNKLTELSGIVAERLICPTYSRQKFTEDIICKTINAGEKIGVANDLLPSSSNRIFTVKIKTPSLFESLKFQDFIGTITGDNSCRPPQLDLNKLSILDIPENALVLFPSARMPYKRWNPEKFAIVATELVKKHPLNIVIAGGPGDEEFTIPIAQKLDQENIPYTDLCGKTSLVQLAYLLSKAKLLITNDTSAVHFAASVNCKTVVMLNGTHFGRFCPYPENLNSGIKAIYPPEINEPYNFATLSKQFELRSFLDINSITIERVQYECEKLLHLE